MLHGIYREWTPLTGREIILEEIQPMDHDTSTLQETDGQTTCRGNTALCVAASRGNKPIVLKLLRWIEMLSTIIGLPLPPYARVSSWAIFCVKVTWVYCVLQLSIQPPKFADWFSRRTIRRQTIWFRPCVFGSQKNRINLCRTFPGELKR